MEKIIAIVGTNASGKSGLAVETALRFGGEVISADSRQVYRRMDLGSGKISREEMKGVPHHLIDIRDPGEFFSMADFQRLAYEAIEVILAKKRLPIIAGGTGLYADAVLKGYELSEQKPDLALREKLETMETSELYARLKQACPETQTDPKNRHRVMRALERIMTGDLALQTQKPRYKALKLGVTWPADILKQRIDERLDRRLTAGMADEVRALLDSGVSEQFLIKMGLEYKYLTWFVTGRMGYEQMTEELGNAIKKFAKRQMTWFRRDTDIVWLDMAGDPEKQAEELVARFLADGESIPR